jgi:ribosomal protein S18 acetylase RimI-like enzyme
VRWDQKDVCTARRHVIARLILRHLEEEVRRRGFLATVFETGRDNAGAIALYESEGYAPIPEFLGSAGLPVGRFVISSVADFLSCLVH